MILQDISNIIKNNQLFTNTFFETEYIRLLEQNFTTKGTTAEYQQHHIIPKFIQQLKFSNILYDECITLSVFDHVLAHYYLYKGTDNSEFKAGNAAAIHFLMSTSGTRYNIDAENFVDFLYDHEAEIISNAEWNSRAHKGKHWSEETRRKISKAHENIIYIHNKENINKRIKKDMLQTYIDQGWFVGKFISEESHKKRSAAVSEGVKNSEAFKNMDIKARSKKCAETKANWSDEYRAYVYKKLSDAGKGKIITSEAIEKQKKTRKEKSYIWITNGTTDLMIKSIDLSTYEKSGWTRGRTNGVQPKGITFSEERNKHLSEALKGRKKSKEHVAKLAAARSKYIYYFRGMEFLSSKVLYDYLIDNNLLSKELPITVLKFIAIYGHVAKTHADNHVLHEITVKRKD